MVTVGCVWLGWVVNVTQAGALGGVIFLCRAFLKQENSSTGRDIIKLSRAICTGYERAGALPAQRGDCPVCAAGGLVFECPLGRVHKN